MTNKYKKEEHSDIYESGFLRDKDLEKEIVRGSTMIPFYPGILSELAKKNGRKKD